MNNDTILMAMSGGVDSSAAALLLQKEGARLIGVTLRVWEDPAGIVARQGTCCSLDDVEDARRVADRLGLPHYTLNVKSDFKERVVDYFVDEYLQGRTPNPCVMCNQAIKFDYLFTKGEALGAGRVATGHYARIGEYNGSPALYRGLDREKDQSYFLFSIPPERLGQVAFPLGELTKTATRRLAEEAGLVTAHKRESQEICFVPENDYRQVVKAVAGENAFRKGNIVTGQGQVVGQHSGYVGYTVGQRRGLGLSHPTPLYVTSLDADTNRVTVGSKDELYGKDLYASRCNWLVPAEEAVTLPLTARLRHGHTDAPATITPDGKGGAKVRFDEKQLSITPGQAVVFYHGDLVVGGGWIEKRLD